MHTFVLQELQAIKTSSSTVTQPESGWLDLTAFQDLVFFVDCRTASTTALTLTFQTAPTKDDSLFTAILAGTTLTTSSFTVTKALLSGATVPCARYVRWQLVGPGAGWDTTLRIYVAANSPGM